MHFFKAVLLAASLPLLLAPAFEPAAVAQKAGKRDAKNARKVQDHDRARQAVLRKEVLPLRRILALASGYQAGEVIEIELEMKKNILVYDVHILTSAGVVRELLINPRDGKLIVNRIKAD